MRGKRLSNLVKFLEGQDEVIAAYVFGSHASDKITPLSDFDLALLIDNTVPPEKYFDFRITFRSRNGFPRLEGELDLVILNETPPLLTYEIIRKGKLIYCKDKHRLVLYIARAIQRYLDTKHLRKMQFSAVTKRIKEGKFGHLSGSDPITLEKIRDLSAKITATGKDG